MDTPCVIFILQTPSLPLSSLSQPSPPIPSPALHSAPSLLPSLLLSLGLFTMRDLHNMMSEILKMQDFNHPHVMTLMGMSFDAANTPSMVMPYMANGSLLSYLKMNRPLLLVADTADAKKVRGCVSVSSVHRILTPW